MYMRVVALLAVAHAVRDEFACGFATAPRAGKTVSLPMRGWLSSNLVHQIASIVLREAAGYEVELVDAATLSDAEWGAHIAEGMYDTDLESWYVVPGAEDYQEHVAGGRADLSPEVLPALGRACVQRPSVSRVRRPGRGRLPGTRRGEGVPTLARKSCRLWEGRASRGRPPSGVQKYVLEVLPALGRATCVQTSSVFRRPAARLGSSSGKGVRSCFQSEVRRCGPPGVDRVHWPERAVGPLDPKQ